MISASSRAQAPSHHSCEDWYGAGVGLEDWYGVVMRIGMYLKVVASD